MSLQRLRSEAPRGVKVYCGGSDLLRVVVRHPAEEPDLEITLSVRRTFAGSWFDLFNELLQLCEQRQGQRRRTVGDDVRLIVAARLAKRAH